ncbi:hypothetical protein HMPREF9384_1318 [Streptococcus sanguinis SK160]|uniref:Uncharacterized protein n=1 Tax=Streptococcus sanguinis SK160 TaxID=888812 RepID=F0IU06_STRSA|nr:hypothetical protein HMPREF9384_1318 [Streptococcus sanguinis SK160]
MLLKRQPQRQAHILSQSLYQIHPQPAPVLLLVRLSLLAFQLQSQCHSLALLLSVPAHLSQSQIP